MGSLRLTLCAGAMTAASFAPAAYAADGGVSVTPASPAPGSDIQLRVQGCTGKSGTAASEAFVADAQLTGKSGELAGETRVRSTLDPGTYNIKVTCDGVDGKVKGAFSVVDKKQQKHEKHEKQQKHEKHEKQPKPITSPPPSEASEIPDRPDTPDTPDRPDTPESPVAPVHAGGGGAAPLAAVEAESEGPGTPHAVVGLVLAGVAAVAVAVRSARRGRGSTD
ncbi:hypothetical protein [Streptomyces sp. 2A115]|uniref:hypothetical protein n=1 Tax=Streptomyces sp. 2A115 TaxID=3457439 RepID=UPI003FD49435